MQQAIIICTFLLVALFAAGGISSVGASSHEVVVGPGGHDTIQEGINAADPGDVVLVKEGVYTERVLLNKSVSLMAEDGVVLEGENDPGTAITVNGAASYDDVVIDGFEIRNYSNDGNGILVTANDIVNMSIQNNVIDSVDGDGIHIVNEGGSHEDVLVRDNEIRSASGTGVSVTGAMGGDTTTLVLAGNIVEDTQTGLSVTAIDATITDVTVAGTDVANVDNGAQLRAMNGGTFDGMNVTLNDFSNVTADGLTVGAFNGGTTQNVELVNNSFQNAGSSGLALAAVNGTLTGVTAEELLLNGSSTAVSIAASNGGSISTIDATTLSGIDSTTGVEVFVSNATLSGLDIDTATFDNATDQAFLLAVLGDGIVTDVGLTDVQLSNSETGFSLFADDDATVTGIGMSTVDLRDNQQAARVTVNGNAAVSDVTIHETILSGSASGLSFMAGTSGTDSAELSDVTISDSALNGTDGTGLFARSSGTSTIANVSVDSVLAGNNTAGIDVGASDDSTIQNLTIARALVNENEHGGLWISSTDTGTVSDVTITEVLLNDTISGAGLGVHAAGSSSIDDVTVDTVLVEGNQEGVAILASDSAQIGTVTFDTTFVQQSTGNGVLVDVADGSDIDALRVRESILRDNADAGVYVTATTPADAISVHHSVIARNGAGVNNQNGTAAVDARYNYWGDGSGPSSGLLDPVTDKSAYGTGDSVSEGDTAGVANVRFSPGIGGKADQREDMILLPEDVNRDIEFQIQGATIDDPVHFSIAGETITGELVDFVGISAWERGVLPLRTDRSAGATVVDLPPLFIDSDDGDVSANLNSVAIYNVDDTVPIDYRSAQGAQTDQFANASAQMIVVYASSDEGKEKLRSGDLQDELMEQIEDELDALENGDFEDTDGQINVSIDGIEVVAIQDLGELDADGEMSTTFTPDEPGEYAFLLGTVDTGDGFTTHTDEDLSFNVFNDTVTIVGMEAMTVQRTSSSVTAPAETNQYENMTFSADSNLEADNVTHAVLAYDRAEFLSETVVIEEAEFEELSNDVFRLTSGGERGGEPFFMETTVDTADLDDGAIKLTIHATFNDSDGTFDAIIHENGTVDVLEDTMDGDDLTVSVADGNGLVTGQIAGMDFSLGLAVNGDSAEDITMPLGEYADIDVGTEKTYQWIHVAADQDSSVERSSSADTIEVAGTADSGVAIVDASLDRTEIEPGESVELTVELENLGVEAATDTINVTVDGTEIASREVTLDGGETATETFQVTFPDEGTFEVAANGVVAGTVTVSEPAQQPDIKVTDATLDRTEIKAGKSVNLAVDVENSGPVSGTETISVTVDGTEVASREVTVDAGETTTETFNLRFTNSGSYEVAANGVVAGTVTVTTADRTTPPDPRPGTGVIISVSDRPGGVSITVQNVRGGEPIRIDAGTSVSAGGTTVTGYMMNTTRDMDELNIEVDASESVPDGTPALDRGTALSYFNVDSRNLPDEDFESVEWQFTIDQSVLDAMDRTPSDVRLWRYSVSNQEWEELPTEHVGGEEYTAESPGFSVFAIGTAAQADFEVVDARIESEEVAVDEEFTVTATVENRGDEAGEFTAELEVDGEVVETRDVTVAAGESEDVTFTHTLADAGSYEISVNGVVAGTLEVTDAATPTTATPTETPTETPPETPPPAPDRPSALLLVLGILLVAAGGLAFYVHRTDRFPWHTQ